ncbi:MAG: phage major tail tube protein [Candidatus Cloacimonetes bacterium]|nr:phage major tail tube protein [Candidatus Cloacimonadota bacterium]
MANNIPQLINSFEVYLDGTRLLGTVTAELPNIQFITQEIKGAGISGSLDVPVMGHIQNMTAKFTWRIADDSEGIRQLLPQQYHHLELWSSNQTFDTTSGEFAPKQQKVILRACPVGFNLGQLAQQELQNVEMDFQVSYMRWFVNNVEFCEIDPYNMIFKAHGQDLLASVRSNLGL